MKRDQVYALIDDERTRQFVKWGGTHVWGRGDCSSDFVYPSTKAVVLAEECGEVSKAVLELDWLGLRKELVQVAAVAVAWLEGME